MSNPAKGGGESPTPSHSDHNLRIGVVVYDKVYPETMGGIFQLGRYGVLDVVSGVYVDKGRNQIAERTTEDFLLFVDADMVFTIEDLVPLKDAMDADPAIGAIAALYVFRDGSIKPVVHWINDGMWESGMYVLNRTLENMEKGSVDDVDSFGTGFMLIRTEAMKSIGEPYFKVKWDEETESFWGEDVLFAKRLKENGWRACVHFGVQLGHIGKSVFTPEMLKDIQIPDSESAIEEAGMRKKHDAV